ncbi:MAG: YitT family protein, partial [Lachnospiraceae bacterium]|nr:YitT family protein [Lachnospiraceae bacterium]
MYLNRSRIKKILLMTVGAVCYASAISLFLDPNSLAPGGVSGISIILHRVTGIETGTLLLCLNIPLLIAGAWKFGLKFICSTVYCTVLASCLMNLFASFGAVTADPFLAALAGGGLTALGLGLVFKNGG